VERFLLSLHLDDLALACACAAGRPEAWDYFVLHFRPILYRAARALRAPGDARELADSIYADLYGLEQRDGARRSLLAYFHGRSSLAGWLRSVLAQRAVDRARAAKRMEPLPEEPEAAERVIARAVAVGGRSGDPPDPDRERLLAAARRAFASALASLEPGDRLRLALYYTQGLRLAQIGRIVGESEATVSRKLDRIRRGIRAGVERRLRDEAGLSGMQVAQAFEYAAEDGDFDVRRALPVPDS
jgi:RNA polymerase sigma-70 factor (ECF subfamily)